MIYNMIDVSDIQKIYWRNLVNFFIAIENSNRQAEGYCTSQFRPQEHQSRGPNTHRDLITRICYSSRSPECLITGGRDGRGTAAHLKTSKACLKTHASLLAYSFMQPHVHASLQLPFIFMYSYCMEPQNSESHIISRVQRQEHCVASGNKLCC